MTATRLPQLRLLTDSRAMASLGLAALCALPLGAARLTPASVNASNSPGSAARPEAVQSAYFAEFQGVGAEGRDMLWRGTIAGAAAGELTVRLAHVAPDGAAHPGPQSVEGILFVAGDPARSFAAEVAGTMDLKGGRVAIAGTISEGYRRGERLEYTAKLIDYDLVGELRLAPVFAGAR